MLKLMTTTDVLFTSFNRLEFTKASMAMLRANTNWGIVRRLVIYDDRSEDGTQEWLIEQVEQLKNEGVEVRFWNVQTGGAVAAMNRYLDDDPADRFAKVDNDIVVPPEWLDELTAVMDANPEIELLGMEGGMVERPWPEPIQRTWEPSSHIGGVGLMRSDAFLSRPRIKPHSTYFGLTEFQHIHEPVRGWINPDLLCFCLDRMPIEPWASLSDTYIRRRWQRYWPRYDQVWMPAYWEWWTTVLEAEAA